MSFSSVMLDRSFRGTSIDEIDHSADTSVSLHHSFCSFAACRMTLDVIVGSGRRGMRFNPSRIISSFSRAFLNALLSRRYSRS